MRDLTPSALYRLRSLGERPLIHVYTVDRYQDCRTCTVSIDGQLKGLQHKKEEEKWTVGTMTPSPPWWAGKEKSSLSVGPNAGWQSEQVKDEGAGHHQADRNALQTWTQSLQCMTNDAKTCVLGLHVPHVAGWQQSQKVSQTPCPEHIFSQSHQSPRSNQGHAYQHQ